jgi:hypothetical protein
MSEQFYNTITADSKPDYDDWGWDDYWDIEDWMKWHKELCKRYSAYNEKVNIKKGKEYTIADKTFTAAGDGHFLRNKKADSIWLEAWRKQTTFSNPVNNMGRNIDVVKYFRNYADIYIGSGMMFMANMPIGIIPSTTSIIAAEEFTEDVISGLSFGFKVFKYTLIGIAALAVLGLGAYVYNSFRDKGKIDINLKK